MNIIFDAEKKVFHLKAKDTSYVMRIIGDGYLSHHYWGKKSRIIIYPTM